MVGTFFTWRSFLYLLYALVLTAILLYVRFPKEKFRSFCEYRVEQFLGDTHCSISRIRYLFPVTVVFENMKIGAPGAGQDRIYVDRLQLSPLFKTMFTSWAVVGKLYSGDLEAIVTVPFGDDFFYIKEIHSGRLDIAKIMADMPSLAREITGVLAFSGEYKAEFEHPLAGFGSGHVNLEEGTLHLQGTILTLDTMVFQSIAVAWEYGDNAFRLSDGKMVGKQLGAEFAGILQSPFPVNGGRLDVVGSLVPKEKFVRDKPKVKKLLRRLRRSTGNSKVSFKVGGTLNKPTFRLTR